MEERDEEDFKKAAGCYISDKPPVRLMMVKYVIIAMLTSSKALIKFGIFALPVAKMYLQVDGPLPLNRFKAFCVCP